METKQEVVYYGGEGDERLSCSTVDEYMESVLDIMPMEKWPETIRVSSFIRLTVDRREVALLDDVLDRLDENYGDPEGYAADAYQPTKEMRDAEKALQDLILKHYKPWMCEDVSSEEVNVKEWVTEHRPHWLEEESSNE